MSNKPTYPSFLDDRKVQTAAMYRSGEEDKLKSAFGEIPNVGIRRGKIDESMRPHSDVMNSSEKAQQIRDAVYDLVSLFDSQDRDPSLTKADGSLFHKLVYALNHTKYLVLTPNKDIRWPVAWRGDESGGPSWEGGQSHVQIFVVEHDWAKAFAGSGLEKQLFALPFDVCCFEFQIWGKRICALAFNDEELGIVVSIFINTIVGWAIEKETRLTPDGNWESIWTEDTYTGRNGFYATIVESIKAICISLEAEIATTDVVRAPHKLNAARQKRDKIPLFDYHVVQLARRHRVAAMPAEDGREPRWRVRLHFRRGHWRHFENSKTWIKWCLVGDPDLGFVDKHYRL